MSNILDQMRKYDGGEVKIRQKGIFSVRMHIDINNNVIWIMLYNDELGDINFRFVLIEGEGGFYRWKQGTEDIHGLITGENDDTYIWHEGNRKVREIK